MSVSYQTFDYNCYFPRLVCFNNGYQSGIDIENAVKHFAVLGITETSYSTIYQQALDKVGINVTAKANGAQHATAIRGNLWNYSLDGRGCTAIYGQAVGTDYGRWSAAIHGETKHLCELDSGLTAGVSIEVCTFSAKGLPYGLLINNTTGSTGETVAGKTEQQNPNTTAIRVTGNSYKYGLVIDAICEKYFVIQGRPMIVPTIPGFPDVQNVTIEEFNKLLAALRMHGLISA